MIRTAALCALGLILPKLLEPDDFGLTRIATAYVVFLAMAARFSMNSAVAAHVSSAQSKEERTAYVANGTYFVLVTSIVVTLLAEAVILSGSIWQGQVRNTLALVVLGLPFIALSTLYADLNMAVGETRRLALCSASSGLVQPIIVIGCVSALAFPGWISGRLAAYMATLILSVWFARRHIGFAALDTAIIGKLFRFGRMMILSGLLSMGLASADIFALERLTGDTKMIAYYGLAAMIVKATSLFPTTLATVFFRPLATAAQSPDGPWHLSRGLLLLGLVSGAAIALVVYLVGPFLIRTIYGTAYESSVPVLRILSSGIPFLSLWAIISSINIVLKVPRNAVGMSVVGGVSALLSFGLLIPWLGVRGAAWSMVIAQSTGALTGVLLLERMALRFSRNLGI